MKKIFTLISVALIGLSANAQEATESWSATSIIETNADGKATGLKEGVVTIVANPGTNYLCAGSETEFYENETDAKAHAVAVTLNDYVIEASTTNMKMKAVSTPNNDATTIPQAWSVQDKTGSTQALDKDECTPKYTMFVQAKAGNPSVGGYLTWWKDGNNGPGIATPIETYWTPGCGQLPDKGAYYEFTASKDGGLKAGIFVNKNLADREIYIVKKSDLSVLSPDKYWFEGYLNNNTWTGYPEGGTDNVPYNVFKTTDDYKIVSMNQHFMGYIRVNVEANETYVIFTPKSQIGIYGFEFTPGADVVTGIDAAKADLDATDAPVYNLAGQRVAPTTKGLLIKNGKKFINR